MTDNEDQRNSRKPPDPCRCRTQRTNAREAVAQRHAGVRAEGFAGSGDRRRDHPGGHGARILPFYNYFRTNEELLVAVAAEVSNELLLAIDPVVQRREDPAERVACGTRLVLHAVVSYPLLGAFLSCFPMPTANSSLIGIGFLARDVNAGIASDRFPGISPRVALDLVIGALFSAAHSLAGEKLDDGYPEAIVRAMLRG
jgi:hypothetical protein